MAFSTLLQRWIEVLARLTFVFREAWGEVRGGQRAVIVSCEGDRFVLRKMPAPADISSVQADQARQAGSDDVGEDTAEGRVIAELEPGKPISGRVVRAVDGCRVIARLPAAEVVVRRISVPAGAREFLAGIVGNQIDRLSPWQSDQAAYGFDAEAHSEDPANLDVRVLIAARGAIDALRDKLAAMGLLVDRVVGEKRETGRATFITLWSRLATLSGTDLDRARRRVGTTVAAVVGTGVALSLWALVSAASLRSENEDAEARTKVLLHQVEGAGGSSLASFKPGERAWYEKEVSPTVAIVIEAVSRALPDAAYLTELHLEGVTLRLVGLASDPPSLIAPLEHSGHLSEVHFFAPTTREADGGQFRFHIEARVKPHFTIGAEGS
jgi:general secretion pathway protein L